MSLSSGNKNFELVLLSLTDLQHFHHLSRQPFYSFKKKNLQQYKTGANLCSYFLIIKHINHNVFYVLLGVFFKIFDRKFL